MNTVVLWEMVLIAFVKGKKLGLMNSKVATNSKACGTAGIMGNKGGMQIHFKFCNYYFNFIGCHLVHGQDKRVNRDEMMEDIIRKLKIERQEMDPDVISDYSFIMGDLNYRFQSTYEDMVNNNQIDIACTLLPEKDQLTISMNRKGNQLECQQADGSFLYKY